MIPECRPSRPRPMPRVAAFAVVLVALTALPATAAANAGTPLMWTRMFHLVAGNFIIGAIEGGILAYLMGLRVWPCVIVMVVANYFSAACGPLLYTPYAEVLGECTIYNVSEHLTGLYVASYIATLVFELPFALATLYYGAKGTRDRIPSSPGSIVGELSSYLPESLRAWVVLLSAFLLSQSVTYAALSRIYMNASATSLAFATRKDPSLQFLKPFDGNMYYLDSKDDRLYRMDLADCSQVRAIGQKRYDDELYDRLFVHRGTREEPWTLAVGKGRGIEDIMPLPDEELSAANYSRGPSEPVSIIPKTELAQQYREYGGVAMVPAADLRGRGMNTGDWAALGLLVRQSRDWGSPSKRYALEVPLAEWPIRNATLLPDDIVIFQLGTDQIVALDLKTDTVGLLARGRGPLVTQRIEQKKNDPELDPKPTSQ